VRYSAMAIREPEPKDEGLEMTKNTGIVDRTLRIIVAVVLIGLVFGVKLSPALRVIMIIVAAAFLVTSTVAYCPLYVPLKLNTGKIP